MPVVLVFRDFRSKSVIERAGAGSLQVYRTWPPPLRPDLTMFAFAIERGDMFDRYGGYELGTCPDVKPDFDGGQFAAAVAT